MARGKTISVDLRERAVNAYENGEGTYQEIADRFCIGRTTLCDLVRLSRYANTLDPLNGRRRTDHRIDEIGRGRIEALVLASPDATLAELTDAYNAGTDKPMSTSTLGRAVRALELSRKKSRSGRSSGTRTNSASEGGNSPSGRRR
ncbi:MAG: helix-turn-helix protein [Cyanobacteria bacterium RYN_339]|nr:helix-turn-helix protein [Cyanobacteria bacterium RYN_339]